MSKHTPGPWESKSAWLNPKDPMFYKADVVCGGIRIAQVAGVGEEAANANARLISAAPKLLEALETLVKMFEQDHRDCEEWVQYKKARQAIKKAEKEETQCQIQ